MIRLNNLKSLGNKRKYLRLNQTKAENILWLKLKNKQLGVKFRRQQSIGPYIVDFYCFDKKLIIEVDGGQHNDEETKEYDEFRTQYLKSVGLKVIRFWDNEVMKEIDRVMEIIFLNINTPS